MNLRKRNSVKKIGSLLSFVLIILAACIPPSNEEYTEIIIDYSDAELKRIIDLQVKQDMDSLFLYLNHPNPTYRLYAAKAFASFQKDAAVDSLVGLLEDPFMEVKTAAAFALGQIRSEKAVRPLIQAFAQQDTFDVDNTFNETILEAVGKTGNKEHLNAIATVSTYRKSDTLLLHGQANAIYQFGLRNLFSKDGDEAMFKYLTNDYPLSVQKVAAQYFLRFKDADLDEKKFQLLKVFKEHRDPDIRMALATALTRKAYPELFQDIIDQYNDETDYRVKCNILSQIGNYPYINIVELTLNDLSHDNAKVSACAAQFLYDYGNAYDAPLYLNYIQEKQNPYTKIKVYQSVLKHSGRNSGSRYRAIAAIKKMLEDESLDPYVHAAAINALSEDQRNLAYLFEMGNSEELPIVHTRIMEGIAKLFNRGTPIRNSIKASIRQYIKQIYNSNQSGAIAASTELFTDENIDLGFNPDSLAFLETALGKLKLPEELETYNLLNKAIAIQKGQNVPETLYAAEVKPIDWNLLDQYSAKPIMRISTSKGDIAVELFKQETPQSVSNIIQLIKSGYYNKKYFHRVVPNFVVQGGCPNGDGYGALDYTIRSELTGRKYDDEGYIGYASAGLHTESCQWFITHSPTPHLNGKYTIFGKVIEGMNVVHLLEVGDQIQRISISN